MHVGVAHHFGWAVLVAVDDDLSLVDRRRAELIEPGLPSAPIHHLGGAHELHRTGPVPDDRELADLVADVRASISRTASAVFDDLGQSSDRPVASLSVRDWPAGFPDDIATLRRAPYESRADSVMYCQVLAEAAQERGWRVHRYDAKRIEAKAADVLGARAPDVLDGARARWGTPWAEDHRVAFAATVVASRSTAG